MQLFLLKHTESGDFHLVPAENGEEAVQSARAHRPGNYSDCGDSVSFAPAHEGVVGTIKVTSNLPGTFSMSLRACSPQRP